ncbi:MAG TPA: carboxypeptidase regulatory-like domain-containing protein [Candidatus Acidoferrum sp.]|jgi:hypothetical protein|nr:carboxypeptidase regulatory-like domain-containing protein [Candidatus Acidoferrum sp.]
MKSSFGARRVTAVVVCLLLLFSTQIWAQANTVSLRGTVTDPSGSAIAGAIVTATPASGTPVTATSDATGGYEIRGLAPGVYDVKVTATGFQDFDKPDTTVTVGHAASLDVPLLIQVEKQQVEVSSQAETLDTSADKNASAITIQGSDLSAISDDPDQMAQDLQALAGPATGPNGGEMYVNGFTAGQLPPKSSIREIRVNQNPFSAEFSSVGFGRIEILTKPGTDKLHGNFWVWGNDQPFNSWSPFVQNKLGYYTFMTEEQVGGSLNKRTSFSTDFFRRNVNQLNLGAIQDPHTFQVTQGALAVPNPRTRTSISQTIDYQVNTNNTLTLLYQYWANNEKNDGINPSNLPSQGYNSSPYEHQLQATDTQVINEKMVNETRFQYLRDYYQNTPVSTALAISAPGYIVSGGNSSGLTTDTQNHYELQNYTTMVKGKHSAKFGARLRYANDTNYSLSNANGAFAFATSQAYLNAELAIAAGQPVATADYPTSFALGTGSPTAQAHLFDGGFFVQDDWQLRPNFTLSTGFRLETQTGIPDHADPAPRIAIAWGVGKTKSGAPRTVLRGGWGMFYSRFPQSNILNTNRFNGTTQVTFSVPNPNFFPNVPTASELAAFATQPSVDTMASSLRAPYTMQAAATLEQQFGPGTKLTVNYINARGVHQLYTANINTPLPGTFNPADPQAASYPFGYNAGFIDQYASGGIFKQNQLVVDFDGKAGKYLSLWGYYVLNNAKGTTGGLLSDYYDTALDYGRVGFDIRNRVFVGGSFNLPHGFQISPYIQYASGQPFNITSGTNLYGSSITGQNARPSFTNLRPDPPTSADPTHIQTVFATPWGNLFNGATADNSQVIPINLGTGPSQFSTNLSVNKTFKFGPPVEAPSGDSDSPGAASPAPKGKAAGRYSLQFGIYVRNVFNQVNYGQPVGVIGSSQFLQPTGILYGNAFNRQVSLQARFAF